MEVIPLVNMVEKNNYSYILSKCLFQEMKESHEGEGGSSARSKESKMDDTQIDVEKSGRRESESYLVHPAKARHKRDHKPLARTQSSPLVTFSMLSQSQDIGPVKYTFTT
ncbi:MAG: hypothetical protein AB2693_17625, partial [Candidatus Thiodiazotropha sp.]